MNIVHEPELEKNLAIVMQAISEVSGLITRLEKEILTQSSEVALPYVDVNKYLQKEEDNMGINYSIRDIDALISSLSLKIANPKHRTGDKYRYAIKHFKRLHSKDVESLKEYLIKQQMTPKSKHTLAILMSKYMFEEGYIKEEEKSYIIEYFRPTRYANNIDNKIWNLINREILKYETDKYRKYTDLLFWSLFRLTNVPITTLVDCKLSDIILENNERLKYSKYSRRLKLTIPLAGTNYTLGNLYRLYKATRIQDGIDSKYIFCHRTGEPYLARTMQSALGRYHQKAQKIENERFKQKLDIISQEYRNIINNIGN